MATLKCNLLRRLTDSFVSAESGPVAYQVQRNLAHLAFSDWGDASPVNDGEIAVFWACGVTPQAAILHAKPAISITHKPGQMLITDVAEDAEIPIINPAN